MHKKKEKDVRLIKQDDMLGSYISENLSKMRDNRICPSSEELAAFIDGKLSGQDKERIMEHLVDCKDCHLIFKETINVQNDTIEISKSRRKKIFYTVVPLALAATVALVVFLRDYNQTMFVSSPVVAERKEGKQEGKETIALPEKKINETKAANLLSSPRDIAVKIGQTAAIKAIGAVTNSSETIGYGFSSNKSSGHILFKIGVGLTDLEVTFLAGDREKTLEVLKVLASGVKSLKESPELITWFDSLQHKIEQGSSLSQLTGESKEIEASLKGIDGYNYLKFGVWAEGGRLAALTGTRDYFDNEAIAYFIKNIIVADLRQGVSDTLEEIQNATEKGMVTERDYKEMATHFKNLILLM